MKASVTWSTQRIGNDGYVREEYPDGTYHVFGPLPAHIVPAFVQGRRRIIETKMNEELGATRVRDDTFH